MRNRDAVAERGRTQPFALEQAGENIRCFERVGLGEQFGCVLEQLFLAGKAHVQQGGVGGDEGGDQVHADCKTGKGIRRLQIIRPEAVKSPPGTVAVPDGRDSGGGFRRLMLQAAAALVDIRTFFPYT
jgi:hypothetical protein